jgi:hypothetical protein
MSTFHAPFSSERSLVWYLAAAAAILALILAAVSLAWVLTRDGSESSTVVPGSGVTASETRDVAPFSAVELAGANDVTIGVGGEQRVVVSADDNLIELVTTDVRDDVLVIDTSGSFDAVTPMRVEITVPTLDDISLSGSGAIVVDGHELDELTVAIPGAGSVRAVGTAAMLDVDLSGTGEADLAQLVARDATVDVSGAGAVLVHVTGALEVDVSGTGSVSYAGDPDEVEQSITGTGTVTGE